MSEDAGSLALSTTSDSYNHSAPTSAQIPMISQIKIPLGNVISDFSHTPFSHLPHLDNLVHDLLNKTLVKVVDINLI